MNNGIEYTYSGMIDGEEVEFTGYIEFTNYEVQEKEEYIII